MSTNRSQRSENFSSFISVGLVNQAQSSGNYYFRVDRRSPLGNPYSSPELWQTDCDAYRAWLVECLKLSNTSVTVSNTNCTVVDPSPIAQEFGVTTVINSNQIKRKFNNYTGPSVAIIRAEIDRIKEAVVECSEAGETVTSDDSETKKLVYLLCHCKRPFRELGGRESPCHGDVIREVVLNELEAEKLI